MSSVVCDVLYCGLYDRQTADVCTHQGVFWDGRFNGIMQNVVGPTLVAITTTFGTNAEIQLRTGLSVCLSVCL